MPLRAGDRLGPYEITGELGAGGMGIVLRARDTKLDRDVALKVLPEAFTSDPDRLARFEREAKVLASLNHPNIGSIYGLEEAEGGKFRALVLELVEGPTLADRIKQGPISLDDALPVAKQIAEALEAAHEQGIIHRDLKPANVKVKDDGTVKVLDFGLAKALDPNPEGDPSQSPTLTAAATQMGVIMGTAAYMSPEQATGKTVDKRADIWSFGAVLFEMLTGDRLFTGETVSHVLAGVLERHPDFDALPANTPSAIAKLLRRCLQKDRTRRLQDVGDVRLEIEETLTTPSTDVTAAVAPHPASWQRTVWVALATLVVGSAVAGIVAWNLKPEAPAFLTRFAIPPPPLGVLVVHPTDADVAITPDGTRIVYRARLEGGPLQLFVRELNQLGATPLRGVGSGPRGPFTSPDGRWVGYFDAVGMKKVSIQGGPPVTICDGPPCVPPRGASWGPDDTIVFASSSPGGLWRVSGAGGEPEELTTPSQEEGEQDHLWPQILPGGEAVLFTIGGSFIENSQIAVLSLDTGARKVLIEGGSHARYSPTDHLLYGAGGALRAVPFELGRLEVIGDAVPVVAELNTKATGAANFSLRRTAHWCTCREEISDAAPSCGWTAMGVRNHWTQNRVTTRTPRVSPDGARVAVAMAGNAGNRDIYVYDLARRTPTRLTFDPADEDYPVWTSDGQMVAFRSTREGGGIFARRADGTGNVERLTTGSADALPFAVSRDGALIFGNTSSETRDDLHVVPVDAGSSPAPLLQTQFDEEHAALSPDNRWLAYTTDEASPEDIYVRPFPNVDDAKVRISTGGAREPLWGPSGRELFYRGANALMTVSVETNPELRAGTPKVVFQDGDYFRGGGVQYDIGPNGRFLMINQGDVSTINVNVVLNWHQELLERVPIP